MEPVVVTLQVTPSEVDASTIADVTVRGTVRNSGDDALNVRLYESDLYINGQTSWEWQLAIGNGPLDPLEASLPPGATLEFARHMGASLFRGPGTYQFKLRVLDVESPPVTVSLKVGDADQITGNSA